MNHEKQQAELSSLAHNPHGLVLREGALRLRLSPNKRTVGPWPDEHIFELLGPGRDHCGPVLPQAGSWYVTPSPPLTSSQCSVQLSCTRAMRLTPLVAPGLV